jgi:hypothetical protein
MAKPRASTGTKGAAEACCAMAIAMLVASRERLIIIQILVELPSLIKGMLFH